MFKTEAVRVVFFLGNFLNLIEAKFLQLKCRELKNYLLQW